MEQIDNILLRIRKIEVKTPDSVILDEGVTLTRLFLKRSSIVVDELFPALDAAVASDRFERMWLNSYQSTVAADRSSILDDVARCSRMGEDARFYTDMLPSVERRERISSIDEFREYLFEPGIVGMRERLGTAYQDLNNGEEGHEYIEKHFFLLKVAEVLYQRFAGMISSLERFNRNSGAILEADYQRIGIKLAEADQQFAKYGLLTLDDNIRISNNKEGQAIVDRRIEKRYAIDVPRGLLSAIELANSEGLIGQLSFHVESISELSPALEALEYGSIFGFDALNLPDMTRLFDDECYENSLWIKVDKQKSSLTFEELFEDFKEVEGKVVTQVLHLELQKMDGQYYINHIDHEYILYSLLDYAERQRNGGVKGHEKLKTFKIDNARIPLSWKFDGKYFLFLALNARLLNRKLIREYFEKIQVT